MPLYMEFYFLLTSKRFYSQYLRYITNLTQSLYLSVGSNISLILLQQQHLIDPNIKKNRDLRGILSMY